MHFGDKHATLEMTPLPLLLLRSLQACCTLGLGNGKGRAKEGVEG